MLSRRIVQTFSRSKHGTSSLCRQTSSLRACRSRTVLIQTLHSARNTATFHGARQKTNWAIIKDTIKERRVAVTMIVLAMLTSVFVFVYSYQTYLRHVLSKLHNYPELVAKPLRKAFYFSDIMEDPQRALRYYQEAMVAAEEAGMDPFSDEVLGIRIHVAGFLERKDQYDAAITILEQLRADCVNWVKETGNEHFEDGERTRVLEKVVGLGAKLGDLYSREWVGRHSDAEKILVETVEIALKEKGRRDVEGEKAGEGKWVDEERMGAPLEALGQHFQSTDRHYLATPLYVRALSLCPPNSCHAVVLMNNIATSLVEQGFHNPLMPQGSTPPLDFPTVSEQAAQWARRAIELAESIPAEHQTEDCAFGCATAKAGLATIAERAGRLKEALKLFLEAEEISRSTSYSEGTRVASAGAKRVRKLIKAQTA